MQPNGVFFRAIRPIDETPTQSAHITQGERRGFALLSASGHVYDYESKIQARAIGLPVPPSQSSRNCHSRRFGTPFGHWMFLSSCVQSIIAKLRLA